MNKSICLLMLLLAPLSLPAQTIKDYIRNDWPDDRYEVHGDGTVTDTVTGLMWMQCSLGQTYSDYDCSDETDATKYNWRVALEAAEDHKFATHTDWRLPNIKELDSLVAYNRHDPAINSTVFPNTPTSSYWSASPYTSSSAAWTLSFNRGSNGRYSERYGYYYVRLVRSGQ